MTAIRGMSVFGLVVLLAAATAAADTVITADEVISCSLVSADTCCVRLRLPQGGIRVFPTRDVREFHLSDSSRFADLASRLRPASVTPDSAQPALRPPAPTVNLPWRPDSIDTLPRKTSPTAMAAKCREMAVLLRECGRSNDTVLDLVCKVSREHEALRVMWPQWRTYLGSGMLGWLLGASVGILLGEAIKPTVHGHFGGPDLSVPCDVPCGALVGGTAGCVAGPFAGIAVGAWRRAGLIATHRGHVNDLIRRVNLAVVTAP